MNLLRSRRVVALAAGLLGAVVAVPVITAGPSSAASGRCAPGTGVTVVVDYGPLGGGIEIGCDPDGGGKPAAEVVTDAGFTLDYVSSQPGFVCRVDGLPGPDEEDCGDTPPGDAYWGLFWSDADPETWAYSSEGAGSLDVPEGGSIGWRFQDGGDRENPGAPPTEQKDPRSPQPSPAPSSQPSGPPAAAPNPAPSAPPDTGGASTPPDDEARPADEDTGGREGSGPSGAEKDEGGQKAKDGKGKDDRPSAEADPQQAASPSPSTTEAALSPASDEPMTSDGSSTALTLVAGAAVLLLVGAAGLIAWRRRD